MKVIRLIIVFLTAIAIAACSSIDCQLNGKVMCHYAVNDAAGGQATLAFPVTVTLLRTDGTDSILINKQRNASALDLPMSYNNDVDAIKMTLFVDITEYPGDTTEVVTTVEVSDTIRIRKTNTAMFESVDCSPRYNHNIEGVEFTRHFLQDVKVNNPKVSNDASVTNIILCIQPGNN